MKNLYVCIALLGASGLAAARPVVVEESATIDNPDPATYVTFGRQVATNGEYALLLGGGDDTEREPVYGELLRRRYALLYRRVAGQWQYQQLLKNTLREYNGYNFPSRFAMNGNLAVAELDGDSQTYRLGATGWQPAGPTGFITEDIEISGNKILQTLGDCTWSGRVYEPDATGTWVSAGLSGQPRSCDDEHWGGPADIDGDRAILGHGGDFYDDEWQQVPLFLRSAPGSWYRYSSIVAPSAGYFFSGEVVMRGDDAVVDTPTGAYVYRFPNLTTPVSRIQAPDIYLQRRVSIYRDTTFEKSGDLVFVRELSYDRGTNVINVFRAISAAPGHYEHVAVLTPKGGGPLSDSFDVSGNVVIAGGTEVAYVFELPASLRAHSPRQDNFEPGSAANWVTNSGSQFAVVTSGTNRLYRQSSTAGTARALLSGAYWTNQAIEAEVTPRAIDGSDRWVGLTTRYQNAQNYFYVALRSSGSLQLNRVRAGVTSTLATTAAPFTLNRNYRLRLESIGGTHRAYVDGALMLDVDVADTPLAGSAGLLMNRARADFDNVVVTPSPLTSVFVDDFATAGADRWTHSGSGQWTFSSGAFTQNSVAAEARAVIGGPTEDQVVQARVRQIAWSGAGTAERWAGVLARYQDDANYYYLHLRSGGTVSLRKLVNGAITTLASAPLAVSLGTQYALRLEVVGNQLRGYVNGNLLLQATDSSHVAGISGLMTNKAAAQFDDYIAYQP
jgi:hypothetical protein